MARVAGVNLPPNKRIEVGLTYIFGIGRSLSHKILKETGIDFDTKVNKLTTGQVDKLKSAIEKTLKIEGELRRERLFNIKRLKDIGSYRGTRHAKRLPVRGQRTKTNSRTIRGNVRRTMGSGHKPPARKV
jgi:small subunit ribosomal protein S13